MTTKQFLQKFKSGYIWLNLALMALVVVAMVGLIAVGTDLYTHHGEVITVPDLKNKKFADAEKLLEDAGLIIVVNDTSYNRQLPPNCILQQLPLPGAKVKSGRIIFVTINASQQPTLTLPDILDNSSLREAQAKLRILGFKLGEPQYIPGEKDWVYGATCRGRSLVAGSKVPLDAMVILQVGNGTLSNETILEVTDPEYEEIEETETTQPEPAPVKVEEDPFEVVTE